MNRRHTVEHLENWTRAKSRNEPTYYGPPCKYQHNGLRYTANKVCVTCSRTHSKARYRDMDQETKQRYAKNQSSKSDKAYRMWHSARNRARAKNRLFTITLEDIIIPDLCPVFGTPMESPSLDRMDNTKGYTPNNIRVISKRANSLKNDATVAELEAIVRYMKTC